MAHTELKTLQQHCFYRNTRKASDKFSPFIYRLCVNVRNMSCFTVISQTLNFVFFTPNTIFSDYMLMNCVTLLMFDCVNSTVSCCSLFLCSPVQKTFLCLCIKDHIMCLCLWSYIALLFSSPSFPSFPSIPVTVSPLGYFWCHCWPPNTHSTYIRIHTCRTLCHTWTLIHWNLRQYSASINYYY